MIFPPIKPPSIAEQSPCNTRLLNLHDFVVGNSLNSYKKKAIETGIAHASGELIVCTDADCIGTDWISLLVNAYSKTITRLLPHL